MVETILDQIDQEYYALVNKNKELFDEHMTRSLYYPYILSRAYGLSNQDISTPLFKLAKQKCIDNGRIEETYVYS